ncbi:MAG TPA: hypothetical protein VLB67_11195 [Acidimicrobiia bacterium]|nr:hypothetical protein [Acidimicrobiia bacterium]
MGGPTDGVVSPGRRKVDRPAAITRKRLVAGIAAAVLSVSAATAVYVVAQDDSAGGGASRNATSERSMDEILRDLANRGLIPAQALDPEPVSVDGILRDLVNRGLIPAQTLDG